MSKRKIKIVYRSKPLPKIPAVDEHKKVREEIKELETKRTQIGGGARGFLQKLAVNRQIYNKQRFITDKDKIRNLKQQNELGRVKIENEDIRNKLNSARKVNQVNFNDLFK